MTNNKGFTLLEAIISIFIVTMGVGGVFTLINQTIGGTRSVSLRLTATYLAQEGIETVRNIRDGNFLKIHKGTGGVNWDTNLTGCQAGCEADYNDTSLAPNDRYLRIDGGFYNYDSGTDTIFKRKITVTPSGSNILQASVVVSWQERGGPHQVTIQENLYQWIQ
ncbi:MAG: prepilin-type N-terminal cleavage/methylation domain-containing protein [bacterium]|nr:prepilin-type N-terminal cleavage/methylation domain-containing protein [bacterium]